MKCYTIEDGEVTRGIRIYRSGKSEYVENSYPPVKINKKFPPTIKDGDVMECQIGKKYYKDFIELIHTVKPVEAKLILVMYDAIVIDSKFISNSLILLVPGGVIIAGDYLFEYNDIN